MTLSIFDIATSISWTEDKRIYLKHKENIYDLLCEYLSGFNITDLTSEIESLKKTQQVLNSNNKELIEKYFIDDLYGFEDDGSQAYVGGAMDFSVKLLYDFNQYSTLLKHVYGTPNEQYQIDIGVAIKLLQDLQGIFYLLVNDTTTQERS